MSLRSFLHAGLTVIAISLTACSTLLPAAPQTDQKPATAPTAAPAATPTALAGGAAVGALSTKGGEIVDARGREVILTGVNWFGFETGTHAPHGLWYRNWESMLDQIVALGFNAIRLPYSNEIFRADAKVGGVDYDYNPDLEGLTPIEVMDKIVDGAGRRGLKILLDRHRPDPEAQSKLWYTDRVSEEQWIADWVKLAKRYRWNDAVIGADLHNEPAGKATWGTDIEATDWRLAAERAGNAIHEANPDWLIVVEGIEKIGDDLYWYGGSLKLADEFPVRLKVPNKLVYSVHDYGPGVWKQPWFKEADFPRNLDKKWDLHWGFVVKDEMAPIIVGEFGGRGTGQDVEGVWQRRLLEYLKANRISYTYWSFNANSGDTGGILHEDWASVYEYKVDFLRQYQFPLLGKATIRPRPGADRPKPAVMPTGPSGLRVGYRPVQPLPSTSKPAMELRVVNDGGLPLDLKDVELRYWLKSPHHEPTILIQSADVGTDAITGKLILSPAGGQTHYVKITFARGQVPAKGFVNLSVQLRLDDGAQHAQADDYSYAPWKFLKDWDRVGLYLGGQLVWGRPPGE
ncbi:MAG: cellulase family glycosylhydrolase [Chloroflexi bacterium]|nr:cellulase family glycosylhydrolase [Chloroflexota bacterium]